MEEFLIASVIRAFYIFIDALVVRVMSLRFVTYLWIACLACNKGYAELRLKLIHEGGETLLKVNDNHRAIVRRQSQCHRCVIYSAWVVKVSNDLWFY